MNAVLRNFLLLFVMIPSLCCCLAAPAAPKIKQNQTQNQKTELPPNREQDSPSGSADEESDMSENKVSTPEKVTIIPENESPTQTDTDTQHYSAMNNDDVENSYSKKIFNELYGCFKSYVTDTSDPNEFIGKNGTRIKLAKQNIRESSIELSEADIANGVLWENYQELKVIYDSGSGWRNAKLFFGRYQYYSDGSVKIERTYTANPRIVDGVEVLWWDFGSKCYHDDEDARILYK